MTVLFDTGVIFAYLYAKDDRHEAALELVSRVATKEFGQPFVTDHVVDELFALARSRARMPAVEEAARRFLPLPDPAIPGLTVVSLGTAHLGETWEVFRRYRDQKLSFTDASLLVTLRELRLDRLATFDDRLARIAGRAA